MKEKSLVVTETFSLQENDGTFCEDQKKTCEWLMRKNFSPLAAVPILGLFHSDERPVCTKHDVELADSPRTGWALKCSWCRAVSPKRGCEVS